MRNAYVASFCSEDNALKIAEILGVDAGRLVPILKKARGNHATITGFLRGLPRDDREKGLLLLESLTEKDLTDVGREVLDDHVVAIDEGRGNLFGEYVMSPRIADEEMTPFRSFFRKVVPDGDAQGFHDDPQSWVKWVNDNIDSGLTWYPEQITMSPEAVWRVRKASPLSRDVFFVAGARCFGIPARIDPITGKTQWADASGRWINAVFSDMVDEHAEEPVGILTMEYSPTGSIPDPKYYSHFTLSKMEGGKPILLNYPDFIGLSETFSNGESLDRATYLSVTGQRMADGGVLAHIESIALNADSVAVPLSIRQDDSKVQVIGSFDSESHYMPIGADMETSILSTTGRGYYVLAMLKPNHEPSNHVIRDLAEAAAMLEASGRPMLLLTEEGDAKSFGIDLNDFPPLPSTVNLGTDLNGNILEGIAEGVNLTTTELPILIVADTFNRVVFISEGYTIGIGDKLASLLGRLE